MATAVGISVVTSAKKKNENEKRGILKDSSRYSSQHDIQGCSSNQDGDRSI